MHAHNASRVGTCSGHGHGSNYYRQSSCAIRDGGGSDVTDSRGIASTRAHNSSPEGAGGCAGWCAPLARSGCARLPRGSLRPPRRPTSALCSLSHPPLSPPWPPPPLVSAWPSPGGNEQVEHVWDVWRRIRRLRWPAELATEAVRWGRRRRRWRWSRWRRWRCGR